LLVGRQAELRPAVIPRKEQPQVPPRWRLATRKTTPSV